MGMGKNSSIKSGVKTFAEFISECYEETEYSREYKQFGQKAIEMGKIATPIGGWVPSDETRRAELEKLYKILAALGIDATLFKNAQSRKYELTESMCDFFHFLLFLISESEQSLIRRKKFDRVSPTTLVQIRTYLFDIVVSLDISPEKRQEAMNAFEQRTGCPLLFGSYNASTLTDKARAEMIRAIASAKNKEKYSELFFMADNLLPPPEAAPWWNSLFSAMIEDYARRLAPAFVDRWKRIAKDLCAEENSGKSDHSLIDEIAARYP